MNRIRTYSVAATLLFAALPLAAQQPAASPPRNEEPIIVRRFVRVNESLPDLAARLYDSADYELKLRKLDAEIKTTKFELQAQRERLEVYDTHFPNTPALLITRQNARREVLKTELRLKRLRYEKLLALRHRADRVRMRKLLFAEDKVRLELDQ